MPPSRPKGETRTPASRTRRPAAERDTSIHELRNCLAVIANAIYYLKLVAPPDDRVRTYLTILEREAKAASGLIDASAGGKPRASIKGLPGGRSGKRA